MKGCQILFFDLHVLPLRSLQPSNGNGYASGAAVQCTALFFLRRVARRRASHNHSLAA